MGCQFLTTSTPTAHASSTYSLSQWRSLLSATSSWRPKSSRDPRRSSRLLANKHTSSEESCARVSHEIMTCTPYLWTTVSYRLLRDSPQTSTMLIVALRSHRLDNFSASIHGVPIRTCWNSICHYQWKNISFLWSRGCRNGPD